MHPLFRHLLLPAETLVYGPAYGVLQHLIRCPTPLDPQSVWDYITGKMPALGLWIRNHYPPTFVRPWLIAAKMRQDHLLGIAEHYDISNDFYALFLDKKYMFYSCADFPTGKETLEEAQAIKADFILNLIDPKPGEKILELGCGWGAMLKRIYEQTGDKSNLYGLTLSKEQVAYNQEHNGFNVELKNFITADYPDGFYAKIYSIGAWEHVRKKDTAPLLRKLYTALQPGGKLVQHFFCRLAPKIPTGAIAAQIFFPGSVPAHYGFQVRQTEATGFRMLHHSVHDYRNTLRCWFDNLVGNRDQALELVGTRIFNKYVVFFPTAWRYFDEVTGILCRFVFRKP